MKRALTTLICLGALSPAAAQAMTCKHRDAQVRRFAQVAVVIADASDNSALPAGVRAELQRAAERYRHRASRLSARRCRR